MNELNKVDHKERCVDLQPLVMPVIKTAIEAGKEILVVYKEDFEVEHKSDDSPLTLADKRSHNVIHKSLSSDRTFKEYSFPILSEEGRDIRYDERKNWEYLWIVDPLDGTKEFIKRNGEFTVNIALVHKGTPVLGVIYVPVQDVLYFAAKGVGAFKYDKSKLNIESILKKGYLALSELCNLSHRLPIFKRDKKYTVVASRSHMSEETKSYVEKLQSEFGEIDILSKGSSLKICMVAEGAANIYPRFGPTMEWDTAAGHIIAKEANFNMYSYPDDVELVYNKENLLNPYFIVK